MPSWSAGLATWKGGMLPGLCGASWTVQCPHETPPRLPLLWEVSGPLGAVQEHSPGLASSPFPSWHLAQCWAPWTLPQGLSIPSAPPPPQTWCSGCLSSTQVTLAPAWPEPPPEQSVACLPRTSSAAFPGSWKTTGVFTGGGTDGLCPGAPSAPVELVQETHSCVPGEERVDRVGGLGRTALGVGVPWLCLVRGALGAGMAGCSMGVGLSSHPVGQAQLRHSVPSTGCRMPLPVPVPPSPKGGADALLGQAGPRSATWETLCEGLTPSVHLGVSPLPSLQVSERP